MLLLCILIKILFKNVVYKQHRRSQGEKGRPPTRPIAMPAMINLWPKRLFFHQFLFLGLYSPWQETVKTFSFLFFFGSSPFFEKIQLFRPWNLFLFFCLGLHYISWGLAPPQILIWSPAKFRSLPQSKLLSRSVKTFFFLVFTYVICGLGRPQSKILATPMINDESNVSK